MQFEPVKNLALVALANFEDRVRLLDVRMAQKRVTQQNLGGPAAFDNRSGHVSELDSTDTD